MSFLFGFWLHSSRRCLFERWPSRVHGLSVEKTFHYVQAIIIFEWKILSKKKYALRSRFSIDGESERERDSVTCVCDVSTENIDWKHGVICISRSSSVPAANKSWIKRTLHGKQASIEMNQLIYVTGPNRVASSHMFMLLIWQNKDRYRATRWSARDQSPQRNDIVNLFQIKSES